MKKKCVIVDDEPLARKLLIKYIQKIEELELVGECKNIIQLHQLLDKESIDLIFLDIEMPLIKGTEFLRTFESSAKVIFTTAHKDYAFEAFELNVVDYLLKPISFSRLFASVRKYFSLIDNDLPQIPINNFLTISINRRKVNINCSDIIYVESMKDYVNIYTQDKSYKTKQTLFSIENELNEDFIRVHRSFIINRNKIVSFSNKQLIMKENTSIPVGKTYQDNLQELW